MSRLDEIKVTRDKFTSTQFKSSDASEDKIKLPQYN